MDSRMLAGGTVTEWHAGQHAEAGWGILANRENSQGSRALFLGRAGSESWKVRADGGGYRYALCPKPKTYPTKRYMDLSESCFQETTLKFGIPDRHTFFVLLFRVRHSFS